ncbi:MAG TPA: hypothetical protein VL337_15820 [Acidimicrobiales bacterium]|nr:hypothetical protein [Acidimicrobiales bacterium]
MPGRLELATRGGLVAVLLAQAAAIVIAEPWSEGAVLFTLRRGQGVTEGDLPAVALVLLALVTAWLSWARMRSGPAAP